MSVQVTDGDGTQWGLNCSQSHLLTGARETPSAQGAAAAIQEKV